MSDDFLAEIDSAINEGNSSSSVDTSDLTKTPEGDNVVTDADTSTTQTVSDFEKEALGLMGDDDDDQTKQQSTDDQQQQQKTKEDENTDDEKAKADDKTKQLEDEALGDNKGKKDDKNKKSPLDTFLNEDKQGNLVLADGTVVASSGRSRQIFEAIKKEGRAQREQAQKLAVTNVKVAQQLKTIYDHYQKAVKNLENNNVVKDSGLSEGDFKQGIDLMKLYGTDPVGAIKKLLTMAQMRGIDLTEIGTSGSIDPATVQQMISQAIEEKIAPVAATTEEDRANKKALQEASDFLEQFPEARDHHRMIGLAKKRYPDMSLAEIWLRLKQEMTKAEQEDADKGDNVVTDSNTSKFKRPEPSAQNSQKPETKRVVQAKRDPVHMSFYEIAQEIDKEMT